MNETATVAKVRGGTKVGTVRPGGRAAKVRACVLDAVLDQLADGGLNGVTVEAVAARAGVHKTTVYRRWPNRADLIRDALTDRLDAALPIRDTGDVDTDLAALARAVADVLSAPLEAAVTRALVAATPHDEVTGLVHDYWSRRLIAIEPRIRAAIDHGQLPPGTDPARVVQALAAPLFFKLFVARQPLDDTAADQAARDSLTLTRHQHPSS